MAIIGLQKGSGKGQKSVKSQGILIWIMSGNPVKKLFTGTLNKNQKKKKKMNVNEILQIPTYMLRT